MSAKTVPEVFPVQKQTNYIDCGSLAIAFANCLAHYETPLRWFYDTTKLRQHLISCLEAVKMSVFPTHSTNEKKKTSKQHYMLLKSTVYAECNTIHAKTMIRLNQYK